MPNNLLHFEPTRQPDEPHPTRAWAAQAVAKWRESRKPGSAEAVTPPADAYTTQPLPSLETLLGDKAVCSLEPRSGDESALHPTRAESLDDADGMVYVGRRSKQQSVNAKMKALGI